MSVCSIKKGDMAYLETNRYLIWKHRCARLNIYEDEQALAIYHLPQRLPIGIISATALHIWVRHFMTYLWHLYRIPIFKLNSEGELLALHGLVSGLHWFWFTY